MNGMRCAQRRETAPSTPNVGRHGVAAALDGEAHDVLGVEVGGVGRERGRSGVLDALVHRQDRYVAGAGQAAVVEQRLQVAQHLRRAVGGGVDPVHEVRAGQVKILGGDGLGRVTEQVLGVGAQESCYVSHRAAPVSSYECSNGARRTAVPVGATLPPSGGQVGEAVGGVGVVGFVAVDPGEQSPGRRLVAAAVVEVGQGVGPAQVELLRVAGRPPAVGQQSDPIGEPALVGQPPRPPRCAPR